MGLRADMRELAPSFRLTQGRRERQTLALDAGAAI
jgi:hypothetical protein